MCGGGGGGPSSSDLKQQKQWQRKVAQRQNKQFKTAQRNAANQHSQTLAANKDQFDQSRQDSMDQFNASMAWQIQNAEAQRASQEAQFAAAQAQQEEALRIQMEQNERMALEAEKASNRAMGMKLVGQDADIVKVRSKAKGKARKKAALGTTQLANPLTISLGGGS